MILNWYPPEGRGIAGLQRFCASLPSSFCALRPLFGPVGPGFTSKSVLQTRSLTSKSAADLPHSQVASQKKTPHLRGFAGEGLVLGYGFVGRSFDLDVAGLIELPAFEETAFLELV